MHDVMSLAQAGYIDYGFLGGARLDPYGNINTTVIGDWDHPKARLPGCGGANDIGSFCWHDRTSCGRARAPSSAARLPHHPRLPDRARRAGSAGLPAGGGPYRVITQLGVYGFDETTKRCTCSPSTRASPWTRSRPTADSRSRSPSA